MSLVSTTRIVPGGWLYKQKETGWEIPSDMRMAPFPMAVQSIVQHRQKNNLPGATIEAATADLDTATCQRLGFDPRWCVDESKKNSYNPQSLFQAAKSHVLRAATALVSGTRTALSEWLGGGNTPVAQAVSQARADVCLGCPFNYEDSMPLADSVAEAIKRQMEAKAQAKLSVVGEDRLKTCQICWCNLPLKVHIELKEILDRTPAGMQRKFAEQAPHCWINTEQHVASS